MKSKPNQSLQVGGPRSINSERTRSVNNPQLLLNEKLARGLWAIFFLCIDLNFITKTSWSSFLMQWFFNTLSLTVLLLLSYTCCWGIVLNHRLVCLDCVFVAVQFLKVFLSPHVPSVFLPFPPLVAHVCVFQLVLISSPVSVSAVLTLSLYVTLCPSQSCSSPLFFILFYLCLWLLVHKITIVSLKRHFIYWFVYWLVFFCLTLIFIYSQ